MRKSIPISTEWDKRSVTCSFFNCIHLCEILSGLYGVFHKLPVTSIALQICLFNNKIAFFLFGPYGEVFWAGEDVLFLVIFPQQYKEYREGNQGQMFGVCVLWKKAVWVTVWSLDFPILMGKWKVVLDWNSSDFFKFYILWKLNHSVIFLMKYISGTGSGKEQEGERTEQEQPRVHSLKDNYLDKWNSFYQHSPRDPKTHRNYPGPKDSLAWDDSRLISSKPISQFHSFF